MPEYKNGSLDVPKNALILDYTDIKLKDLGWHKNFKKMNETFLFPDWNVSLFDQVRQGDLGECFIDAALISIASTNRYVLQSMIVINNDDTCTVRLYDNKGKACYYKISRTDIIPEKDEGRSEYHKHAPWAAYIEKAYAVHSRLQNPVSIATKKVDLYVKDKLFDINDRNTSLFKYKNSIILKDKKLYYVTPKGNLSKNSIALKDSNSEDALVNYLTLGKAKMLDKDQYEISIDDFVATKFNKFKADKFKVSFENLVRVPLTDNISGGYPNDVFTVITGIKGKSIGVEDIINNTKGSQLLDAFNDSQLNTQKFRSLEKAIANKCQMYHAGGYIRFISRKSEDNKQPITPSPYTIILEIEEIGDKITAHWLEGVNICSKQFTKAQLTAVAMGNVAKESNEAYDWFFNASKKEKGETFFPYASSQMGPVEQKNFVVNLHKLCGCDNVILPSSDIFKSRNDKDYLIVGVLNSILKRIMVVPCTVDDINGMLSHLELLEPMLSKESKDPYKKLSGLLKTLCADESLNDSIEFFSQTILDFPKNKEVELSPSACVKYIQQEMLQAPLQCLSTKADVGKDFVKGHEEAVKSGIAGRHAYAVLKVTEDGSVVRIANPWQEYAAQLDDSGNLMERKGTMLRKQISILPPGFMQPSVNLTREIRMSLGLLNPELSYAGVSDLDISEALKLMSNWYSGQCKQTQQYLNDMAILAGCILKTLPVTASNEKDLNNLKKELLYAEELISEHGHNDPQKIITIASLSQKWVNLVPDKEPTKKLHNLCKLICSMSDEAYQLIIASPDVAKISDEVIESVLKGKPIQKKWIQLRCELDDYLNYCVTNTMKNECLNAIIQYLSACKRCIEKLPADSIIGKEQRIIVEEAMRILEEGFMKPELSNLVDTIERYEKQLNTTDFDGKIILKKYSGTTLSNIILNKLRDYDPLVHTEGYKLIQNFTVTRMKEKLNDMRNRPDENKDYLLKK